VTVKGLKKCCISSAVGGTDDGVLWNDCEEDGSVGMRKMKAWTVKMGAVTVIGNCDRI
jgi:hypothetical protein